MAKYNLGVPSSSVTNTMGTPGIAGVNTKAGQNFSLPTESQQSGGFFGTKGGKILAGVLGGGLGLLGAGIISSHTKKVRAARALQDQGLQNLMNMDMTPEQQQALAQSNVMANQGMDAASLQIAREEQARGQNAAFSALGGRRSMLSAMPGLMVSSGDFAKRLAAQNAMIRRDNQMSNIGLKMQYGQQANALTQMKNEALINKGTADRDRLNQTATGALNAVGNIAGSVIKAFSDFRLKDNITLIGKSESGLNIYTFEYKGQEGLYEGVMAQELIGTKYNDAILTMDNGMYAVDYSKLDVQFKRLN